MEWVESLKLAINYIEEHLLDDLKVEDVASQVYMSSFYFQKGFSIMTGYTIAEYIRNRRLYLAALELCNSKTKIIDVAYHYGYDTPESFTKAFTRFHGVSPKQVKQDTTKISIFLPLKITIQIQGGKVMNYEIEKMVGFKVIGFERVFNFDNAYQEIPKFWNEIQQKYYAKLWRGVAPSNAVEMAICQNNIGEFGVCIDDTNKEGSFRYMVAGTYQGGEVPAGMVLYEFPNLEWVKFSCIGALPFALQTLNTKIFKEWLPGNNEFSIAAGFNIEWYSQGDMAANNYESGIWVPVVRKK